MDTKKDQQAWFINFFGKKTVLGAKANVNEELAPELHKPEIKKLKRKKVYARFKDNIWATDLAEVKLLSSNIEVLNIYFVQQMFSSNMLGLNL